jgi:carbon monoxide dehydrogenase subunit G
MIRAINLAWFLLPGFLLTPTVAIASDDIVVIENVTNAAGVKGLRGSFTLAASRERIWDLLTDYEHFRETFTGVRKLKVLSEDETGALVNFEIRVAFLTFEYTLQRHYDRPGELLTWWRTGGDFETITGSWQILPGPRDGTSRVIYESYVEVGFLIPTAIVRDRAARELKETVDRMRERLAVPK